MNNFSSNYSPSASIRKSGTAPVISWYFIFSRVSTTVFPVLKQNSSLSMVWFSSYTGYPSILQIPHIHLYKLIVFLPCQVNFLTAGKKNAVTVISRYVCHIYQVPLVFTLINICFSFWAFLFPASSAALPSTSMNFFSSTGFSR